MLALYVIDIGDSESTAQLLGRDLHRSWSLGFSGCRLHECRRKCGVEGYIAFDLLQGLVNVAIQNRDRAEPLQIGEGLSAIFGSPSPLRVNRPKRNVRKDDDRGAGFQLRDVVF